MIGAAEAIALLAAPKMNDRKRTILLTLLIQKQIIGCSKCTVRTHDRHPKHQRRDQNRSIASQEHHNDRRQDQKP